MLLMMLLLPTNAAAKKTTCWVPEKMPFIGRTRIEYTTGDQARQEEAARAANELREPEDTFENGYFKVWIDRVTLSAADTRFHTVVMQSRGEIILRREGGYSSTNRPSGVYKFWTNLMVVPVPDGAVFPLTVHAIDRISESRCTWIVTADGAIARAK